MFPFEFHDQCHFQQCREIGSVQAERVGQGEVGGFIHPNGENSMATSLLVGMNGLTNSGTVGLHFLAKQLFTLSVNRQSLVEKCDY